MNHGVVIVKQTFLSALKIRVTLQVFIILSFFLYKYMDVYGCVHVGAGACRGGRSWISWRWSYIVSYELPNMGAKDQMWILVKSRASS